MWCQTARNNKFIKYKTPSVLKHLSVLVWRSCKNSDGVYWFVYALKKFEKLSCIINFVQKRVKLDFLITIDSKIVKSFIEVVDIDQSKWILKIVGTHLFVKVMHRFDYTYDVFHFFLYSFLFHVEFKVIGCCQVIFHLNRHL